MQKSQVGRNPTAQPRPHRLPTLPPTQHDGLVSSVLEKVSGGYAWGTI